MKSAVLWTLAVLNVLLVVLVVNRFLPEQRAHAQVGRPSDYIMIPGELNGVATGVIFIVDTSKGRFAGRIYIAALYDYPVYRVGVFRSVADMTVDDYVATSVDKYQFMATVNGPQKPAESAAQAAAPANPQPPKPQGQ